MSNPFCTGDEKEASRWRAQTARIALDWHQLQRQRADTKLTARLIDRIWDEFEFIIQSGEKAFPALREVSNAAIDCAYLLRSSSVRYSWEQPVTATAMSPVRVGDVRTPGPPLGGGRQGGDETERNVAFVVFGALVKDYSIMEDGRPVTGRAIIRKPMVVLC